MQTDRMIEDIQSMLPGEVEIMEDDNLLRLGLTSLKIMRLVNQWRKRGIRVSFGQLMETPTLRSWARIIEEAEEAQKQKHTENENRDLKIKKTETGVPFPLTDVQYAYRIGREDDQILGGVGCHAYMEFTGRDIDTQRLEAAWKQVQLHHPMLRAAFTEDGQQMILEKPYDDSIRVVDLTNSLDPERELLLLREELSHRKLKVEQGQVAGITLAHLADGSDRMFFDVDLLVADVQSLDIILRDIGLAYRGIQLPEASKNWSFADYLEKQELQRRDEVVKAEGYWKERLETLPHGPELPLAKEPSEIIKTHFTRRIVRIEPEEWDRLRKKSAEENATPAMMMLAAFAAILGRWSSKKDFLINIPLFNRNTEFDGMEDVVADFTDLLLLEVHAGKNQSFRELLNNVQNQMHRDMKYSAFSGVRVQRELMKLTGDSQAVAPVVYACNFGNPLISDEFRDIFDEFTWMVSQTPGVWLDFQSYEDQGGLLLTWDTVDGLFPDGLIEDMLDGLNVLLRELAYADWDLIPDVLPEYQKAFIAEQKEIEPLKQPKRLFDEFLDYAENHPEKTAIVDTGENRTISYGELKDMAFSIAGFLSSKEVTRQPVAITTARGWRQAAAALGILLSDNIYVPVSLKQPVDRRKAIHDKTGIGYVITDVVNVSSVKWPENTEVWVIEEMLGADPTEMIPEIAPEDFAYIIMTSGTTGLPKGAEMRHQGAWNTIDDVNRRCGIGEQDIVAGISSMDFDLSVYDLFGMLSAGGTLLMIPEEDSRNAEYWLDLVLKYQVTVWNSVPVLLDMLLICAEERSVLLPLRVVMMSGDWIGMDLPERLFRMTAECRFIAMGGATEASIWSNFQEVELPLPAHWHSIPYGRPLAHQSYRVVDSNGMDTPFWVEGELWIGGAGVGTYRGDDELVRQRFLQDSGSIWYRTGDKGRFWPDGTIEFLGRMDFQVKIRGHRIELGEIETALKGIEGIRNAVVDTSEENSGEKHLIAFIEADPASEGNELFLKNQERKEKLFQVWEEVIPEKALIDDESNEKLAVESISRQVLFEVFEEAGLTGKELTWPELIATIAPAPEQTRTLQAWVRALAPEADFEENRPFTIKGSRLDGEETGLEETRNYLDRLSPFLLPMIRGEKDPLDVFYRENDGLTPVDLMKTQPGAGEVQRNLEILLQRLAARKTETVEILEIGSRNPGATETLLSGLKNIDVRYTYADPSAYFCNVLREKAGNGGSLETIVWNPSEQMAPDDLARSFDCVVFNYSLHRMREPETVLERIRSVLKPEGFLLFSEITENSCIQLLTALVLEEGELTIRSREEWMRLLTEQGYSLMECCFGEEGIAGNNLFAAMMDDSVYELDSDSINAQIDQKLPEYMIPHIYIPVRHMPLNKNGKIDRKALKQTFRESPVEIERKAPETETEEVLLQIWKEIFNKDEIGTQDNYYQLGGDSLLAVKMLAKIKSAFQIDYSISDLMSHHTICDQASQIEKLKAEDLRSEQEELPQIIHDEEHAFDPFPLTEVQRAYWLGRSGDFELGNVSTHCYFELDSQGMDLDRIQDAWNAMIREHGMMRVVIHADGTQQILRDVPEYVIARKTVKSGDDAESVLEEVRKELSHQVIDTENWPLFDVRATILDGEHMRLHISFDNLIFDGWSMFHILSEWTDRYYGRRTVASPSVTFRDYVLGLQEIRNTDRYNKDREYWESRLDDFSNAPELPLRIREKEIERPQFVRRSASLSEEEWRRLRKNAGEYGITPSILLMTAYSEVLRRWSGNDAFTLNLTQFDRKPLHQDVERLIGDFTTLTLLEVRNSRGESFRRRAEILQDQLMQDLEHSYYSAVEVERTLRKKTGKISGSLMPVVFTSGIGVDQWNQGKWPGYLVYNVSQTPQVWLDHQVVERDGNLDLFWDSVDELFYPGMIDQMFKAYVGLLKNLSKDRQLFTKESHSLVNVEVSEHRTAANRTEAILEDLTLDEMMIRAERQFSDKTAVVSDGLRLSYQEILEGALFIGKQLEEKELKKEELVAVYMDKGWRQILSVYGILFAGGAYLPIDPENPRERIEKILNDSGTRIILVQPDYLEDRDWLARWECIPVEGKGRSTDRSILKSKNSDELAYTIYTSGSTGTPKGVMISHRNAVNTILDINRKYQIDQHDVAFGISNLHFDLSVYDIFGLLGCGGTLVIPDKQEVKEPDCWLDYIEKEHITVWNSVPAFAEMLVSYEQQHRILKGQRLRLFMLSGDWIRLSLPEALYNAFGEIRIVAMGGATEASIWSNYFNVPSVIPEDWRSIPYGKPLANQRYYVLDQFLQDRPERVPGTIYIGGRGVAKGYLNDPEKTAASFIHHPVTGEYLYNTGDSGTYWEDGNIEFLGRLDRQMKINGYRVESGEIEAAINSIESVDEGKVLLHNGSLFAFIRMISGSGEHSEAEVRSQLESLLPSYMIPERYIYVEEFPLTGNGKVDHKKLLELADDFEVEEKESRELQTETEKKIGRLWRKVLECDEVFAEDDFFLKGGDSLKAVHLVNEVSMEFGVNIKVRDVFSRSRLDQMAAWVDLSVLEDSHDYESDEDEI